MNLRDAWNLDNNHSNIASALSKIGISRNIEDSSFVAGSMFWFRPNAITRIKDLSLTDEDFGPEMGRIDGTIAHAVERIFGIIAEESGYSIGEMLDGQEITAKINPLNR